MRTVDWSEHLGVDGTLAVDCTSTRSAITHTQFASLKIKDADRRPVSRADGMRGRRSTSRRPDVRVNLHLDRDVATLAIDLAGDSLHRRGYRGAQGAAPLKENLAAAMLLRAGWAKLASSDDGEIGFVDPMCGSGSLAIEAALIAGDVAPGPAAQRLRLPALARPRRGGSGSACWPRPRSGAPRRASTASCFRAYDRDPAAVRATLDNAARARASRSTSHAERRELADLPAAPAPRGLLAVNPPYGERLGEAEALKGVYALLGEKLKAGYVGWQAAVLTGNPPLGRELRIKAKRTHTMFNGPIECRLLRFDIEPKHFEEKRVRGALPPATRPRARGLARRCSRNRLRKNVASLGGWARKEGIACYRVYDADMPEYAFSIDLYAASVEPSAPRFAYVQEYAPPATIDADKARARREEAFSVIPEVLDVPRERVHVRTRRKQKRGAQYEKLAERGEFDGRRRGRSRAARQLHGLPRHGLVPRPSADAGAHSRARRGQDVPEPVRVHGDGVGVRRRGRRARDDERRSLAHLSRLGAPQPRAQRLRRRPAPSPAASRRARVARAAARASATT